MKKTTKFASLLDKAVNEYYLCTVNKFQAKQKAFFFFRFNDNRNNGMMVYDFPYLLAISN